MIEWTIHTIYSVLKMTEKTVWGWNVFNAIESVGKHGPAISKELSKYLHKQVNKLFFKYKLFKNLRFYWLFKHFEAIP